MSLQDLMPLLSMASTIALAVGAYFFRRLDKSMEKLDDRIDSLSESVVSLRTECAVLRVTQKEIFELRTRLNDLHDRLARVENK